MRSGGLALASTPATANLLECHGIPCRVMPTIGLDEGRSSNSSHVQRANGPLRLIFVGRLHLLKGLHLLLQALDQLPTGTATLTIVGDGPERQRLGQQAVNLSLLDIVEFRGFMARTELGRLFDEHDVLVAPSLYESGGLSVLEGFAHGLPAIVLDCGGHAISVTDGCGIRISISSSQTKVVCDLASAIRVYSENPALTESHGSTARLRVRDAYAWPPKRQKMLAIYEELLAQNSEH